MPVNALYNDDKHANSLHIHELITIDTFNLTLGAKYIYSIGEICIDCIKFIY